MVTDPLVWLELASKFRELALPTKNLRALYLGNGEWTITGGPCAEIAKKQLAELMGWAGITGSVHSPSNGQEAFLNNLRQKSPHFVSTETVSENDPGMRRDGNAGVIEHLCLACAEYCSIRALELTVKHAHDSPPRLRRDSYPLECSWLHDTDHEPMSDWKEELDYRKSNVWIGYNSFIEKYEQTAMAWADMGRTFILAVEGLSYDLAVILAHSVADRALEREEAMKAFSDEAAELQNEVCSSISVTIERLSLSVREEERADWLREWGRKLTDLGRPFHRVQDDLMDSIYAQPTEPGKSGQTISSETRPDSKKPIDQFCPAPEAEVEKRARSTAASFADLGLGERINVSELTNAKAAKHARAMTVATLIKELNQLKPQMLESNSEYERLRTEYSGFLTFKIAADRSDLRQKILSIRSSTRHIRLAQELAAGHHGRELSTIQDDWKDYKPEEFRRKRQRAPLFTLPNPITHQ